MNTDELDTILVRFVPTTSIMSDRQLTAREEAKQAIELYCHKQVIEELRNARAIYDKMEGSNESTESWRHWKGVRNVLTDRIEELTGKRN